MIVEDYEPEDEEGLREHVKPKTLYSESEEEDQPIPQKVPNVQPMPFVKIPAPVPIPVPASLPQTRPPVRKSSAKDVLLKEPSLNNSNFNEDEENLSTMKQSRIGKPGEFDRWNGKKHQEPFKLDSEPDSIEAEDNFYDAMKNPGQKNDKGDKPEPYDPWARFNQPEDTGEDKDLESVINDGSQDDESLISKVQESNVQSEAKLEGIKNIDSPAPMNMPSINTPNVSAPVAPQIAPSLPIPTPSIPIPVPLTIPIGRPISKSSKKEEKEEEPIKEEIKPPVPLPIPLVTNKEEPKKIPTPQDSEDEDDEDDDFGKSLYPESMMNLPPEENEEKNDPEEIKENEEGGDNKSISNDPSLKNQNDPLGIVDVKEPLPSPPFVKHPKEPTTPMSMNDFGKQDALEDLIKSTDFNKGPPKKISPPDSVISKPSIINTRKFSDRSNTIRNAGESTLKTPQQKFEPPQSVDQSLPDRQRYKRKPRTDYILNKVPTFNVGDNLEEKKFLSKLGFNDDFDKAYLNMKKGGNNFQ